MRSPLTLTRVGAVAGDVARLHRAGREGEGSAYIGFVGRGNLGDELLYDSNRRLHPQAALPALPISRTVISVAAAAAKRGRPLLRPHSMILGGGTVVGRADWRDRLELLHRASPRSELLVCGVGVEDPDFTGRYSYGESNELARWASILQAARTVSVRGPRSQRSLADVGVVADVVGDPALILGRHRPVLPARDDLIGLNVARPEDVFGGDAQEVVDQMGEVVRLLTDTGYRVRIIPMAEPDRDAGLELVRALPDANAARVQTCEIPADHAELSELLLECTAVVAERLHTLVMAHANFIPAIAIAYRPKCLDHLDAVQRPEWGLRSDELDPQVVVRTVESMLDQRQEHVAHLVDVVGGLRQATWQAARQLQVDHDVVAKPEAA